ncbi:MAG: hypothetical protein MJ216_00860 [Bacilli bacterium]|nr:hypothetical protein [Bacilli bacterium]
MEANLYLCPHCGTAFDSAQLDLKTRRGVCMMCGSEVVFPKRHLTASPNAVLTLEEGARLFLSGNFESAKTCAETVISMSNDNVAALYITNYYKAFRSEVKNSRSLDDLFNRIVPAAEFEIEEEEMFKQFVIKTISHSSIYEEQLLAKFLEYDDPNELAEFVEAFCPFAIMGKQSYAWLTSKMLSLYLEITKKTNIPKTWYALYTALLKNPDSPFVGNKFFLKTKTARIQQEVVEPIGAIFKTIKDQALNAKFVSAYNAYLAKFLAEAAK